MKNYLQKILKRLFINQEYNSLDTNDLSGKVIVLTGGSGEIGSGILEVLKQSGSIVVDVSINLSSEKVDITNEQEVDNLFAKTYKKYGRIDAVINNAGLFSYGAIEEISEKEFDKITAVNIKGVFIVSKFAAKIMKQQKYGTIINIGSKISRNSIVEPKKSLYAMTKYAVEGFSYALNRELREYGVRVICLMPGTVNTFFSRNYKHHMSVYDVAEVVKFVLKMDQVDFEGLVFKSVKQNI